MPKGISRLRGQTARTCLTLGWWETRTQSSWPAKTPPVATVSSTCTFQLAAALRLIVMISKRCSQSWRVKSRLFPRKEDHHSNWRNHQHSSERTSPIPKQERATGEIAMLVLAGGARRVFQRSRRSRRDADNTATPARRGGRGSVHSEGQNPCSEIPNRAFTPSGSNSGLTRNCALKADI
jgi:hypothetical protein